VSVAVVLPTYNEKENIAPLFERFASIRPTLGMPLHLLFVDDGSPDGTAAAVSRLMKEHDWVHLLERGGKKGLGTAYLDGFRTAINTIDPVILVDAVLAGADVAVGSRYIPGGSFRGLKGSRKLISQGANWLARNMLGLSVRDTTTGFKALDRRAADMLLRVKLYSSGFIFQVESLYIFKQNGLKMVEVPFVFELRGKGTSKMSEKEVWEFFRSIVAMRRRNYKETGPAS